MKNSCADPKFPLRGPASCSAGWYRCPSRNCVKNLIAPPSGAKVTGRTIFCVLLIPALATKDVTRMGTQFYRCIVHPTQVSKSRSPTPRTKDLFVGTPDLGHPACCITDVSHWTRKDCGDDDCEISSAGDRGA